MHVSEEYSSESQQTVSNSKPSVDIFEGDEAFGEFIDQTYRMGHEILKKLENEKSEQRIRVEP